MTQSTPSAFPAISVADLITLLKGTDEFALVDVREQGVYARDGHIIHAVSLPLSKLELAVWALVPRASVKLIVTDAGDGELVQRAIVRLQQLGFSDVVALSGGTQAWNEAGQQVYTGSSSYSKAFGEFVEHTYSTPHVSPTELKTWLDKGEVVLLDGRTLGEFEDFSIPGAHAVPNAELPLRVHSLVKNPDTRIVVNCAGRTRSIIGAQALINAGIPNPVAALEDGTMAWLFDGLTLQHGSPATLPAAVPEQSQASVDSLTARYGIDWIDDAGLATLVAERDSRSLYVLDVRTKAEFDAGHLPGSRWAEGGELVQGLDKFVGVRGARVVVVDDGKGVRAAITASWLKQLNRTDVVAYLLPQTRPIDFSALTPQAPQTAAQATVSAAELKQLLDRQQAVVIDLTTSLDYENGHIPGAHFGIRARLDAKDVQALAAQKQLVLTSGDGKLANLAAADLAVAGVSNVHVLEGGTAAWRNAGLPSEEGPSSLLHPAEDVWRSPYQLPDRFAAFRTYLDWERELLNQLAQDRTVNFRVFAPAH